MKNSEQHSTRYAIMSVSSKGDFEGYPDFAVVTLDMAEQNLIKQRIEAYTRIDKQDSDLLCQLSYFDYKTVFLSRLESCGIKYDALIDILDSHDGCIVIKRLPSWIQSAIEDDNHRCHTTTARLCIINNGDIFWESAYDAGGTPFETPITCWEVFAPDVRSSQTKSSPQIVAAQKIWDRLGDIPVDDNGALQEKFEHFTVGTNRVVVWHWIEATFGISVAETLMFKCSPF